MANSTASRYVDLGLNEDGYRQTRERIGGGYLLLRTFDNESDAHGATLLKGHGSNVDGAKVVAHRDFEHDNLRESRAWARDVIGS